MTPEVKTAGDRKGRDRPFPWPCANCLKDEVYPVTMPYATEVKHDGRTYKLTIPALTIPKCRACGELVFSNSVDDQIVQALRASARLLTPQQIREGREALGLQSKELAERLGVAKETLSRWETGMMIQSRAMDNLLRVYFAVPEVRAVLQGAEQDAALGTPAFRRQEAKRPATDLGVSSTGGSLMGKTVAGDRLVTVLQTLAAEKRRDLEERKKKDACGLARPDFIWHYLLQSYATNGRASGSRGLIDNQENYRRVTYDALTALTPDDREARVRQVCRAAKIRMPDRKAGWILRSFQYIKENLGGLEAAKAKLLAQPGRDAKIRFLKSFPGIGPKYARNIMMDVYHEEFRDSIALDVRIKAISAALDLSFGSYAEEEAFYLDVARQAGLNGWELDRLLFNFRGEVESRLGISGAKAGSSKRCG